MMHSSKAFTVHSDETIEKEACKKISSPLGHVRVSVYLNRKYRRSQVLNLELLVLSAGKRLERCDTAQLQGRNDLWSHSGSNCLLENSPIIRKNGSSTTTVGRNSRGLPRVQVLFFLGKHIWESLCFSDFYYSEFQFSFNYVPLECSPFHAHFGRNFSPETFCKRRQDTRDRPK